MTDTIDAKTATQQYESTREVRYAMDRLLYALKEFVRVYPVDEADKLPEHDVRFATGIGKGPETVIVDAIKQNPELWLHALPDDVCIVPKSVLSGQYYSGVNAEFLSDMGIDRVRNHASRLRYEAEERQREADYLRAKV